MPINSVFQIPDRSQSKYEVVIPDVEHEVVHPFPRFGFPDLKNFPSATVASIVIVPSCQTEWLNIWLELLHQMTRLEGILRV